MNSYVMIVLVLIAGGLMFNLVAFAQENTESEFTKFEGKSIQTNPEAQKILDKIEESKKILAKMMEGQSVITEQQKLIDEQRRISQEMLQVELERMNKEYEDFTPRNAFASFVSKFNATHHGIYWDQFNYLEEKVILAKAAKQEILDMGGSFQEAQREYIKYASMPRVEMIETIIELNLKYGFADENTQSYFDKDGKLPRYEDDLDHICYGCANYENIRDNIMEVDSNPYSNNKLPISTEESNIQFVSQVVNTNIEEDNNNKVSSTIKELEEKMDFLSYQMIEEDDFEKQKDIRKSITKVALILEKLHADYNQS